MPGSRNSESSGSARRIEGRGSEIILLRPEDPSSKQGFQYPIKNHGPGTEIRPGAIAACLRALGIDNDTFWDF